MKKYLSIYLIVLIVASCVPGSEQIDRNKELEDFLNNIEEENKKDGPIIYSASWISSNLEISHFIPSAHFCISTS